MVMVYLAIACGLGALVRYFFSRYNQAFKLPFGTLIANLLGCFLIGLFYNHIESKEVYAILATGAEKGSECVKVDLSAEEEDIERLEQFAEELAAKVG